MDGGRDEGLLQHPGRSCWRLGRAARASVLVDAERYFIAFAAAVEKAERSIHVTAWDLHSQLRLLRSTEEAREGSGLLDRLTRRLEAAPELEIRILLWDYSMLYLPERELLPSLRLIPQLPDRLTMKLDDVHPLGGSHHQKMVVVDDAVAFVGGLDLTVSRWDTREHRVEDPRRVDPSGAPFGPFHDAQMVVDGEAAEIVAGVFRSRWLAATGESLEPSEAASDPWPEGVEPEFRDVTVGVARTAPAHLGAGAIREVEQLHVDAIGAARTCIFAENQYLSSHVVGEALAERLREPDGPEVVLVLRKECGGWIEEAVMRRMRARVLGVLEEADMHGRLAVYSPVADASPAADADDPVWVDVHSKITIIDDRLLRVGSANLSNRSMGLDSECDLAIESEGRREVCEAIARFRADLLAEHLGCGVADVEAAVAREGSVRAAIESLRTGRGRTLMRLEAGATDAATALMGQAPPFDPDDPLEMERLIGRVYEAVAEKVSDVLVEGDGHGDASSEGFESSATDASDGESDASEHVPSVPVHIRITLVVAVFVGLAVVWRWTPIGDALGEPARLAELARELVHRPAAPLWFGLAVGLGATLMLPVTALIVACALALGAVPGFFAGLGGAVLSAAIGHRIGHAAIGQRALKRMSSKSFERVVDAIGRGGVLGVALVRLLPIAPFGLVNIAAGALGVTLRSFLLGTIMGMAPGALGLCLGADGLARIVRRDTGGGFWLLGIAAVVLFIAWRIGRRIRQAAALSAARSEEEPERGDSSAS